MRTLWNVISFLAVVHLLALAIFMGWMWQSHRLSAERLHEAKAMFAITVPDAQAAAAKAQQDAQAQASEAQEQERQANPAMDSASRIQIIALIKQQEEQSRRRLADERTVLLQQLKSATGQINQQQTELDKQKRALESVASGDEQRKNDEQFTRTVRQYEQLAPKQGKRMLTELINQKQMDQAVAYLVAMNSRAAGKILKEFKTDPEIVLATELLERMRTHSRNPDSATDATKAAEPTKGPGIAPESAHANGPANPAP